MIKFLFLLLPFLKFGSSTDCTDALVDKAFTSNFKANYYLFLPVETNSAKEARLMILKENFKKYMIALDSSYSNDTILRNYVKDILQHQEKLFFHEFLYKKKFRQKQYHIFYEKNKFDIVAKKRKTGFLKKYLMDYNEKDKYFTFNNTAPVKDFILVYEQLFRMNFLVADGDGFIGVIKVDCK